MLLRRVVLDAMTVSSSLDEVSVFMKTLNSLPLKLFAPHMEQFLDICAKLGPQKTNFEEFLMTLRHLAERPDFKEWDDFFTGVCVVGHNQILLENFMMSVRHLAGSPEFKNWGDLFKIVRILGESQESLQNSLSVAREMSDNAKFKGWEDFGKCVAIFGLEERSLEDLLMTMRHLAAKKDFGEWEAFFGALKILAEQKDAILGDFLMAVRHAINYFHTPDSLKSIFRTMAQVPQYSEACAFGQLDSKQWLIEEAQKTFGNDWGRVFVLAGWIGFLPRFIFDAGITVTGVRSFDIDENSGPAAESLNQSFVQKDWVFKSSTQDITKLTYPSTFTVRRKDGSGCELFEMPELVINTSCEHIADISSWWDQIPKGMRVIVQSNDAFHIPEHVRCFKTLAEFEAAMNMSQVDYRGEKRLADFNRFMLIGRK